MTTRLNIISFKFFYVIFAIFLFIGKFLYWTVLTPICGLLYLFSKIIPVPKEDPNPHFVENVKKC